MKVQIKTWNNIRLYLRRCQKKLAAIFGPMQITIKIICSLTKEKQDFISLSPISIDKAKAMDKSGDLHSEHIAVREHESRWQIVQT